MGKFLNSFCGFFACVSCFGANETNVVKKPNIVFILVDDFRYDAMGYCGNKIVSTPSIDNLASQGIFFRNAFSSTPISSASRASILTGLHERTHRYSFQTGPIDDKFLENAYPLKLKEAGYHTALFGKLGVNCTDAESLFDEIEDYDRNNAIKEDGYHYKTLNNDTVHLTRYTGQKGLDYIEKQDGKNPFFLALCFSAPHAHDSAKQQYFWDDDQEDLYNDVTVPDPIMSEDEYFERLPEAVKNGFSRLRWTWRFDSPEKYQFMMKGYYKMIAGVDQEIAKVRKMLEKKGLADNTVIVFMGDNGYFLGERQIADKWMMYDLSVRIPLIIYDPRIDKHSEVEQQVINVDIPSTFVDIAGGDIPSQWQGKSLKGLLKNKNYRMERDTILIEHLWEMPNIPSCEGVRTDDWKYFRYVNDERIEELYNLKDDPNEEFDLSKDKEYAKVLVNLRNKTDELAHKFSANGWIAPENLSARFMSKDEYLLLKSDKLVFGWTLPYFSQAQKSYQILVASTAENIEKNVGDMWNSGCVFTNNSLNVEYKGKALEKGKTYYWRVRYWDYLNRTSQYSESQSFVYGDKSVSDVQTSAMPNTDILMIWGISNIIDGGQTIKIAPQMGDVKKSFVVYPTLMGDIKADYMMVGNRRNYTITVPANMGAEFVIPQGVKGIVLLNGKPQSLNYGKLQLSAGKNLIQIQNNTF
ncbi:MAG TPA: sulfatase-like hydrolase/transferase [Bacteroides mediterraneensis]|uniref:sulfatase-like hydrolase/transferase n=1 Tax=Bacteroides mediterraneensis TaxID=1841856 RepID=UPI0026F26A80|nr:sulfatase-like hydrolase/transferase [Bacteroides mediterraneensis]HJH63549.1 sulfatase-like hydrolase/transferase [Bacteroides mediterraneensis]